MNKSIIDASSGEVLVNKTPETIKNVIVTIVINNQQFSTQSNSPQKVNEVGVPSNIEQ